MTATIELYQPLHDHLKIRNRRGTVKAFVYVVCIGPVVKICPSENSAHKYLMRLGFVLSNDASHYEHKYKSEDVISLEQKYRKAFNRIEHGDQPTATN